MGNDSSQPNSFNSENKTNVGQHKQKSYEEFFINHHKLYTLSHTIDISTINPKRLVFISITGLYNSWKRCHSMSLYNAILIIPLKQEWIVEPNLYKHDYSHMLQDGQFLTLLRWKNHQKLAIFLLDNEEEYDSDMTSQWTSSSSSSSQTESPTGTEHKSEAINEEDIDAIAPVWRRLSQRLQELNDPMHKDGNGKYNPLILSEHYWKQDSSVCQKSHRNVLFENGVDLHLTGYCINREIILLELYAVTMRFNAIKYILTKSNPTLEVVTNWFIRHNLKDAQKTEHRPVDDSVGVGSEGKSDDFVELNTDWWIAEDYWDNSGLTEDMLALKQFREYKTRNECNETECDKDTNITTIKLK